MADFIMAKAHSRVITGDDKIFGISKLAKEMTAKVGKDKVVNATIGSLLDDDGKLIVLSSIVDVLKALTPVEYGDYAPIAGVPDFLDVVKQAAFGDYAPKGYMEAVATPGGTGAIHNTIQNYSALGETVLTSDLYWAPYKTITEELGRKLETYTMFTESGGFNIEAFEAKVKEVLSKQSSMVILFNAPAHNPTGFTPSDAEWTRIVEIIKNATKDGSKQITFFLDVAYIDFAGENEIARGFLPKFSDLPENLLLIVGFSMSKGYTLYGMRSGAMICVSPKKEIADEFKMVCMFSNRGTWSNGTRPAMEVLVKIYQDKDLLEKVLSERNMYSKILEDRGNTFAKAAKEVGLPIYPFTSGFFVTVDCENQDKVGEELQKEGIFAVPLSKGLRIAISAISEERCRMLPERIAAANKKVNG